MAEKAAWDFDERNTDNNTPLHICCAKGSLNVFQYLTNNTENINLLLH